jgi:hypothetical protein
VPGAIARERGYDVPDVDGHYVVTARTAIFWPFDEAGELVGEDSYGSSDVTDFEQVAEEDLPPEYVSMLEAVGLAGVR